MSPEFAVVLKEIDAKREEISASKSGAFYRGHTDVNHALVPGLLRRELPAQIEHNLYHECFARIPAEMSGERSSWSSLALLQHYGIPTRMLDWTESLATALFFAAALPHASPTIFVINAFRHNVSVGASVEPRILLPGLDSFPDYFDYFVALENQKPWPFRRPVFIHLPWTTDRIRAQKGFFTVHPDSTPLEQSSKKYIRKIQIPPEAIPGALRFLELAGVTEHTIFPDMTGLAGFLRQRYKL